MKSSTNHDLQAISIIAGTTLIGLLFLTAYSIAQEPKLLTVGEVVNWQQPEPDARIAYGSDPLQFGYLRLPDSPGRHPVVVVIHGGCWQSQFDLEHNGRAAEALTELSFATWTIEYRRVGNDGGGWPGTFLDIANGTDYLRKLAEEYPLNLEQVAVMGHSAGGHLALWAGARNRIPESSSLYTPDPLPLKGIVALAAVPQLEAVYEAKACDSAMDTLIGGSPEQFPERYAAAAPANLFPHETAQILISGKYDSSWLHFSEAYAREASQSKENVRFIVAPESGHFEVIDPSSTTWPLVTQALQSLLTTR